MIKNLTNIFYIKYIMEDICTFNEEIGEHKNFLKYDMYNEDHDLIYHIWFNPEYLYENKYILHFNYNSSKHYNSRLQVIQYENLYTEEFYYREQDISNNSELKHLKFNVLPDNLQIALICCELNHVDYKYKNFFNEHFRNFACIPIYCDKKSLAFPYIYLIKRKEEFKSII